MIFPNESYNVDKKFQIITEVYHSLKKKLCERYGESAKSIIGDEGGFCPPIKNTREAFNNIIDAINLSNYLPGKDVFLALDCASSEFYGELIHDFPMLKSIEDGFHEKDYEAWKDVKPGWYTMHITSLHCFNKEKGILKQSRL